MYCFLYKMNPDKAQAVAKAYRLGATKNRSVIYWQIDEKGQCRTGKIMQYDAGTGKRNKTGWGINWVHSKLTKSGKITDFKLSQCLFGLHLVHLPNSTPVMLVESEKTALIMAMFFPQYTWLATGGKSNFSERLLRVIKPMQIIAIPDADGFSKWSEKSKYLNRGGYRITVLDLFKGEDSSRDIADVLLECFNR
ncbi:MAG: DUF6371 domain-containing protein [Oscillospiraceae bacterium]